MTPFGPQVAVVGPGEEDTQSGFAGDPVSRYMFEYVLRMFDF